jgi:hypothetical protein
VISLEEHPYNRARRDRFSAFPRDRFHARLPRNRPTVRAVLVSPIAGAADPA